ncbi:UxaA family hydrolase [Paracoccus mutanolyticus]|uniref:UxaA family hydrolase n=1 Tax=Paracoccus mutanolyticus TaxID=1499308 RepID=UPI001CB89A30|nr:UxaA family hydrolase [Paracoccus mutanolyticus]
MATLSGATNSLLVGPGKDIRHPSAHCSYPQTFQGAEHGSPYGAAGSSYAATHAVGQRLADRIRWWESYAAAHGVSLNANPTPGNKAGGLTTMAAPLGCMRGKGRGRGGLVHDPLERFLLDVTNRSDRADDHSLAWTDPAERAGRRSRIGSPHQGRTDLDLRRRGKRAGFDACHHQRALRARACLHRLGNVPA